jgi:hypothetical protein
MTMQLADYARVPQVIMVWGRLGVNAAGASAWSFTGANYLTGSEDRQGVC